MRTSSWQAMWVEDMPEVMESDKVYIFDKTQLDRASVRLWVWS